MHISGSGAHQHPATLAALTKKYPSVHIAESNHSLARECNRVLLCTKPLDAVRALSEIYGDLRADTHLVSIVACLPLGQIARFFPGSVTRVVPSLTGEMQAGVTLLCHNEKVSRKAAHEIEELISALGTVVVINEEDIDVATDLTSCGPALITVLMEEFARAAVRQAPFLRSRPGRDHGRESSAALVRYALGLRYADTADACKICIEKNGCWCRRRPIAGSGNLTEPQYFF